MEWEMGILIDILWDLKKTWQDNPFGHVFYRGTKEDCFIPIDKPHYIIVYLKEIKTFGDAGGMYYFKSQRYSKEKIKEYLREFINHHAKKNNITAEFDILFNLHNKNFK